MKGELLKRFEEKYLLFSPVEHPDWVKEPELDGALLADDFLAWIDEARKEFPKIGDTDKETYENEYKAIEEWIGKVEAWRKKWFGFSEISIPSNEKFIPKRNR